MKQKLNPEISVLFDPQEELFWSAGEWVGKAAKATHFTSSASALEFARKDDSMKHCQIIRAYGPPDEEAISVLPVAIPTPACPAEAPSEGRITAVVPVASNPTSLDGEFSTAKTYLDRSRLSMAESVCFMALCGFELKRLKKAIGETRGKSFNVETFYSAAEKYLGLSRSTAWRFEQLADTLKKSLPLLEKLIQTPLGQLPPDGQTQIFNSIKRKVDGRTFQQFMLEEGVTKKPKNAKGGHRPGDNDGKEPTADEAIALAQKLAREDWAYAQKQFLSGYGVKFTILDDTEIEAQASYLELALKLRRDWLKSPKKQRNAEHLEEALQEALAPATPEA